MGVQANMATSPSSPTTTATTMISSGAPSPASLAAEAPSPPAQRQPAQRKRKSAMKDFNNDEEYKQFARRRNEATRRCRQKKEIELKDLREEVPQIKAENSALRAENERLKADNAKLVEDLRAALEKLNAGGAAGATPPPSSGKKQKKKVAKTSAVKDNWSSLDSADAPDTTSPEEADYCWYSDFLDTTIAYSPELESYAEEGDLGLAAEPPRCANVQMLDISIPTDDVLCPGPSRQN